MLKVWRFNDSVDILLELLYVLKKFWSGNMLQQLCTQVSYNAFELSWGRFSVPLDASQVVSDVLFTASHLKGAKHLGCSTKHLADIDKPKHDYNH